MFELAEGIQVLLPLLLKWFIDGGQFIVCVEVGFAEPGKIVPKTSVLPTYSGGGSVHTFPAYSVTILRWLKK